MAAILEIAWNAITADGQRRFYRDGEAGRAERLLGELLARFQVAGQLRPGFDPTVMAVTIRAAIDAVPPRLVSEPDLDIDHYAAQIAATFDLATRTEEPETRASGTAQPGSASPGDAATLSSPVLLSRRNAVRNGPLRCPQAVIPRTGARLTNHPAP